jgi:hypothetical protein
MKILRIAGVPTETGTDYILDVNQMLWLPARAAFLVAITNSMEQCP